MTTAAAHTNEYVELEDLCGQHTLSGRGEMVLERVGQLDDNAYVVVLRLDGELYWFQEDPHDGYRSALGTVKKLLDWPQDMPKSAFVTFSPVMVTLRIRSEPEPHSLSLQDKVLYGVSEQSGLVLFEVGTKDIDDYYPSFVHQWYPEGAEPEWLTACLESRGQESPAATTSK